MGKFVKVTPVGRASGPLRTSMPFENGQLPNLEILGLLCSEGEPLKEPDQKEDASFIADLPPRIWTRPGALPALAQVANSEPSYAFAKNRSIVSPETQNEPALQGWPPTSSGNAKATLAGHQASEPMPEVWFDLIDVDRIPAHAAACLPTLIVLPVG